MIPLLSASADPARGGARQIAIILWRTGQRIAFGAVDRHRLLRGSGSMAVAQAVAKRGRNPDRDGARQHSQRPSRKPARPGGRRARGDRFRPC